MIIYKLTSSDFYEFFISLEINGSNDICLQLFLTFLLFALCEGITLAIFKMDGKVPSAIALLKILLITGTIIVESFLKIIIGMVFIYYISFPYMNKLIVLLHREWQDWVQRRPVVCRAYRSLGPSQSLVCQRPAYQQQNKRNHKKNLIHLPDL